MQNNALSNHETARSRNVCHGFRAQYFTHTMKYCTRHIAVIPLPPKYDQPPPTSPALAVSTSRASSPAALGRHPALVRHPRAGGDPGITHPRASGSKSITFGTSYNHASKSNFATRKEPRTERSVAVSKRTGPSASSSFLIYVSDQPNMASVAR